MRQAMSRPRRWLVPRLIVVAVGIIVVAVLTALAQQWVPRWWAEVTGDTSEGQGVVYNVADGDTLTVTAGGEKVKIRLLGIDAPEVAHGGDPAGCGGSEAKQTLQAMLPKGATVSWVTDPISDQVDVYGRVLAYVAADGIEDVGLALIEQGMVEAWVPKGEPYPARWADYMAAQKAAQKVKTGSWAVCPALGR
jgi:endonuclease YncB( thermonuclease family)